MKSYTWCVGAQVHIGHRGPMQLIFAQTDALWGGIYDGSIGLHGDSALLLYIACTAVPTLFAYIAYRHIATHTCNITSYHYTLFIHDPCTVACLQHRYQWCPLQSSESCLQPLILFCAAWPHIPTLMHMYIHRCMHACMHAQKHTYNTIVSSAFYTAAHPPCCFC